MSTIINATTTNGVVIQPDNSGSLVLQTNSGTTALTINTSQNVGIGTTSPSKKLEVYATANSLQIQSIVKNENSGTGVAAIGFNVSHSTEATSTKAGIGLQRSSAFGGGALCFYNNNSGVAGDFTTADEKMRIDTSGNLLFNSGYGSVVTAYGCRAWVNFNGSGTVAIRASGNVSSITDHGTGDYTINFSTSMPDANYSTVALGDGPVNGQHCQAYAAYSGVRSTYSTSGVAISWFNATNSGTRADPAIASVTILR